MNIKLFKKSHDGGPNSGVTGYWLIEWKLGFSIVILRFSKGSREAFHSHAFNAWTWWIKGRVMEYFVDGRTQPNGDEGSSVVKFHCSLQLMSS